MPSKHGSVCVPITPPVNNHIRFRKGEWLWQLPLHIISESRNAIIDDQNSDHLAVAR
jgi:hypothetical protein